MRCKRCRRILTDPEYQALGYGKVCYEKTFGKPERKPGAAMRIRKRIYEDENQLTLFEFEGEEVIL
jgi:hypothetical protein